MNQTDPDIEEQSPNGDSFNHSSEMSNLSDGIPSLDFDVDRILQIPPRRPNAEGVERQGNHLHNEARDGIESLQESTGLPKMVTVEHSGEDLSTLANDELLYQKRYQQIIMMSGPPDYDNPNVKKYLFGPTPSGRGEIVSYDSNDQRSTNVSRDTITPPSGDWFRNEDTTTTLSNQSNDGMKRIYVLAICLTPFFLGLIGGLSVGFVKLRQQTLAQNEPSGTNTFPSIAPTSVPDSTSLDDGFDDTPSPVFGGSESTDQPNVTPSPVFGGSETTNSPNAVPTPNSQPNPTQNPTSENTSEPTAAPTIEPTAEPTPGKEPSSSTLPPVNQPSTIIPIEQSETTSPVSATTVPPTNGPTAEPTKVPTAEPTEQPTETPTRRPTQRPTSNPTNRPTDQPTKGPTLEPLEPTREPTRAPTPTPTRNPTSGPDTKAPTNSPRTPEPTRPPTDPILFEDLPYPEFRYVPWSDLVILTGQRNELERENILANAQILGYDADSWNLPATNPVEWLSYETIEKNSPPEMIAAINGMGFTEFVYDCWINHYDDYDWAELEHFGIQEPFEILGWTEIVWATKTRSNWPDTAFSHWEQLTDAEKQAAGQICYTRELWDGIPIPEWSGGVTELVGNDDDVTVDDDGDNVQTYSLGAAQNDFLYLLGGVSLDSLQILLTDESSPQHQAYDWLTNDIEYFQYSTAKVMQRYALAVFRLGLTVSATSDPDGLLDSWLDPSLDECDWYSSGKADEVCNESGMYERINLQDFELSGPLPMELSLLSDSLKWIFLRGNDIHGTIPTEYGDLTKLERFQMTFNNLSGTIPTQLGGLSKLEVLGIGRNELHGTIPTEFGELRSLITLGIERNEFEGSIPTEVGNLRYLEHLYLDRNMLTGEIPHEVASLQFLEVINVGENDLTGLMPIGVCSLADIRIVIGDCLEIDCSCCTECLDIPI